MSCSATILCSSQQYGGEEQVAMDLKRIYALTIKDELGEWSYVKSSVPIGADVNPEIQTSPRQSVTIEPDPDEFFLARAC